MSRNTVKSPDAFRTISEAADVLDLPQHVLRFWETRFSQIKPMKRSGGRRYYRPTDIALLQGIRHLLYEEGYTIKGVQRILREQGIAHVARLGASHATSAGGPGPKSETKSEPQLEAKPQLETKPQLEAKPQPQPPIDHPLGHEPITPQPTPSQRAPVQPIEAPQANSMSSQVLSQPLETIVEPIAYAESQAVVPPSPAGDEPAAAPIPAQHQPASAPVSPQSLPQAALTPDQPSAFPPLGSLRPSPSSSTLRFMPDVETSSEPAVREPATQLPLQPQGPTELAPLHQQSLQPQPAPATPTFTAPPFPPSASPGHAEPRLSAQDTETLVQALRTLLDCKTILDSARHPETRANSANS